MASRTTCSEAVAGGRACFTSGRVRRAPGVDGVSRLAPGPHAAVHGDDVGVAHLLQVVRRQRRTEPAPAVKDDVRCVIWYQRLDVALQHAPSDVPGAGGPVDRELAVLADVDEMKPLAAVQAGLHVGDAALADVLPYRLDQGQEPGIVLHGRIPGCISGRIVPD